MKSLIALVVGLLTVGCGESDGELPLQDDAMFAQKSPEEGVLMNIPLPPLRKEFRLQVGQVRAEKSNTGSALETGDTLLIEEKWVEASEFFQKFITNNPKHELIRYAYLGQGYALFHQGNYSEAIKSLELTVADGMRDKEGAKGQFLIGECYFEQKQYVKAIVGYAKVEALYNFPQWQSNAAYGMAQALLQKEKRDQARQILEGLIKKYPNTDAAKEAGKFLN